MDIIEETVTVRARSQVTLPRKVMRKAKMKTGDRIIVRVEGTDPETITIRPLRRSYAGVATGVYGTPDEVSAYVQGERDAWE